MEFFDLKFDESFISSGQDGIEGLMPIKTTRPKGSGKGKGKGKGPKGLIQVDG